MKYSYLPLIAALLVTCCSTAQTIKTSLENAVWTNYMTDSDAAFDYTTTEEDTVLGDGQTYLKLFYEEVARPGKTGKMYKGAIRFDAATNRIYYTAPGATETAKILYDFNVQVGDTLKKENGYYLGDDSGMNPVVVSEIDSVHTNDSIWRKRFHFSGIGLSSVVIEGIGNTGRGLLARIDMVPTGNDTRFGCYKNTSVCIYATANCDNCYGKWSGLNDVKLVTNAVLVYPNPVHDVFTISNQTAKATAIEVFDASGHLVISRVLEDNLSHGISTADLPGGFYYYLIKGDDFVQPGKLLKR
jgi:hypothetical protein